MAKETTIEDGGAKGGQIGGVTGGVRGGVTDAAIDAATTLTKRQKEVVKLIAANSSITYNEIADVLGINESAVGKHITAIKNKGVLVRQGGTQGYWEINLDKNK